MEQKFQIFETMKKSYMIKLILATVGIISFVIFVEATMFFFIKNDVSIIEAVNNGKGNMKEGVVELAGDCGYRNLTMDEKQQIVKSIAESIHININDNDFVIEENGEVSQVSIWKSGKDGNTSIKLISTKEEIDYGQAATNQYVLVEISAYHQTGSVIEYKKKLKNCFQQLGISQTQSVLHFTKAYEGELTTKDKNEIANELIHSLGGHISYATREDELYTIYAYTGNIKEYISVAGSKVNLQVAMNYDELKNETLVYLATPILNGSY